MLKSYLFYVVSQDGVHEAEIKTLEERWEGIVDLLGSESFPEFLRVFWNSHNTPEELMEDIDDEK